MVDIKFVDIIMMDVLVIINEVMLILVSMSMMMFMSNSGFDLVLMSINLIFVS